MAQKPDLDALAREMIAADASVRTRIEEPVPSRREASGWYALLLAIMLGGVFAFASWLNGWLF